jgi:hypothetical protein
LVAFFESECKYTNIFLSLGNYFIIILKIINYAIFL